MAQPTLYNECPRCAQAPINLQPTGIYRCGKCGLALKEQSVLGLFKKNHFSVTDLGPGKFTLAQAGLTNKRLPLDKLKIVLTNIYSDDQLAQIAAGNFEVIRPVRTILAQIILEQLNEACFINVNGLRRAHGIPLNDESRYLPIQKTPRNGLKWQDEGNLFCTVQRLVMPSNQFTFIRLDRKIAAVQAFTDGVAIQRKSEEFATYFVGCYPHEAALVAAYSMGKIPKLRAVAL